MSYWPLCSALDCDRAYAGVPGLDFLIWVGVLALALYTIRRLTRPRRWGNRGRFRWLRPRGNRRP